MGQYLGQLPSGYIPPPPPDPNVWFEIPGVIVVWKDPYAPGRLFEGWRGMIAGGIGFTDTHLLLVGAGELMIGYLRKVYGDALDDGKFFEERKGDADAKAAATFVRMHKAVRSDKGASSGGNSAPDGFSES